MGQRERALVYPPGVWPPGGVFRGRAVVMDAGDVQRAIWRIAHEILEHNRGAEDLVVVGLQTGGVWLASALAEVISSVAGKEVPVGRPRRRLLPGRHRPAARCCQSPPPRSRSPLDGAVVVLCDDVLFTGRTVRAALNALCDLGRPAAVQLAVMVDRGHRELPIRPDYVGQKPSHPSAGDGRRQPRGGRVGRHRRWARERREPRLVTRQAVAGH